MAASVSPAGAFHLRPMDGADLTRVLELEHRLFPGDAWSTSMFRDELRSDGRYYLVAEARAPAEASAGAPVVDPALGNGATIIGYAGLRYAPPEGDVQTIAVHEQWWGSGVGTALLAALLTEADRRSVHEMFLDVRADNPRAQRLYQWFGFAEIGVRHGYYRDGVSSIVMRRQRGSADTSEND